MRERIYSQFYVLGVIISLSHSMYLLYCSYIYNECERHIMWYTYFKVCDSHETEKKNHLKYPISIATLSVPLKVEKVKKN